MASENDDFSDVISRRRFVELTGVSGAAALAGCGGGDGGSGTTEDEDGMTGTDGEMDVHEDATHVGATTINPTNVQFNPINTSNPPQIAHRLLFEPMVNWNYADVEFKSAGISEWNFTGDALELTVRDGLTWSNGEDVTGADVARQLRALKADGAAISEWAGDISADGQSVTVSVTSDINPNLVESDALAPANGSEIRMDEETYGEYMGDSVDIEGLRGFADTDPVTNGLFSLANKGEQRLLTERNGDHPDAGNVNFGEYALDVYGGNNARQQALLSLEVDSDFSVAVPARLVANFPDAVEEVQFPDVFGVGFTPHHSDPIAGDRAVRQAMAHAINRELCVQNSLPRAKVTPEIPTGIPTDAQEEFLGDVMDQYESYGKASKNTDAAASVLEDAGYSQQDGAWVDSDGNDVSIQVTVPSGWSDWVLAAETAIQHLNEFGFDAELVTTGSYFDVIQSDDFQFIANTWLHGGPTTYPYYSLRHQLWEPQLHAARYDFPPAMSADGVGGSEETLTVPSRGGSGTTDFNVGEQLNTLATSTDEEEQMTLIQDLAWAANQSLPMIPIAEKRFQTWLTSDDWTVPENLQEVTEANVSDAVAWLPRFPDYVNYTGN